MNQDEFVERIKATVFPDHLDDRRARNRAGSVVAKLVGLVPAVARASLLGGIAYLAYSAWENAEVLICAALAILWVGRGHIRFFSFAGLLGSARFMTLVEMRKNGYLDGVGLILGRAREPRPNRLMAIYHLAIKPLAESEGAVRSFLDTMTGGRLNLMRIRDEPLVRLPEFVHVLLCAPPRSGKGVSYLVPTLMTWDGACVVGDPKDGELYGLTHKIRRSMGFDVIRLDPFHVHGPGGHKINILEYFNKDDPMLVANVKQLADTLVPRSGNERDPHFPMNAYGLLTAAILYVVCHAPPQSKNMNLVRYLLSDLVLLKGRQDGSGKLVKGVFHYMGESSLIGGILAEQGNRFNNIPDREEFGSILSTAQTAIEFLGDPLVAAHIGESTFDVRATTKDTTVYLVLPAKLMSSYANLMKMWLSCFLLARRDQGLGEERKVLYLLDEIGNLGELRVLEGAIHEGAGYGIRLFLVLQSIGQIEANFPSPRCDAIIAGCDVKICMGINDLKSAKMFSEMVGKGTVTVVSRTIGQNENGGGFNAAATSGSNRGRSYSPQARELLSPDELMRSDAAYAFIKGKPPLALTPVKYYEDRAFSDFNPTPLLPTPSIYSWAIALAGLYFALPIAWARMPALPALPRWTASPKSRSTRPAPALAGDDDGKLSNFILDQLARQPAAPAPALPQWPAEAICPRCEGRFDLPSDYGGQVLQCPDCPATFRVPNHE